MNARNEVGTLPFILEALRTVVPYVRTGRNFSNRWKILVILLLRSLQKTSPLRMKRLFDLVMEGVIVETDIRFCIRTLHDFFIVSPLWEEKLQSVLKFMEGMNFLDIGAHIGKYTLRAAITVGDRGKVIAVEPNRDNFNVLARNIELNGLHNCIPLNIAAYSTDKEAILFRGPNSAQHSLTENFGKGAFKVKARALDTVLAELGIDKIDLVKMDVEGAELEVLRGLERTLKSASPRLVIETVREDEEKIIEYLNHLTYKGTLLNVYPYRRGGLAHYYFRKSIHA